MKLTAANINKFSALRLIPVCVALMLIVAFSISTKAIAQERLAMLNLSTIRPAETAGVDSTKTTKPATKTPAFDIMGNSSPLDEILVVDYSAKKKVDAKTDISLNSEEVHPRTGWNSFERYISTSAISPDGKTGNVQVSFMVNHNGSISDVKIKTGLSDAANQKAIEIMKNGPTWVDKSAGGAREVTVTLTFHSQNTETAFL